jgi:hypothetical protein
MAIVEVNKKHGFLDKTGKMAIQPFLEAFSSFSEGLAAIKLSGKYGYMDGSGKIIIEAAYGFPGEGFVEGLIPVAASGKKAYMYESGRVAIPGPFDTAHHFSKDWQA